MSEAEKKNMSQVLHLVDRKHFQADGVLFVEHFEENILSLSTVMGQLSVEGKDLKIEGFCKENGVVEISGEIQGVYYAEDNRIKKRFFERFFQ